MFRKIFVTSSLVILLAACVAEPDQHSAVATAGPVQTVVEPSVKSASPALNLQITREMMDQLVAEETAAMPAEQDGVHREKTLDLQYKKAEPRVKLTGEVYYDEQATDYLEGIDGGRIDVEIKFNG